MVKKYNLKTFLSSTYCEDIYNCLPFKIHKNVNYFFFL